MRRATSWIRQVPKSSGYTGCHKCGSHNHRRAECAHGEAEKNKARLVHQVKQLVARLIAVKGADEVREKLQAVFAKGGSGDDGSRQAHTMPQSFRQRRWETRTAREEPWEVPQPARRLDPRAQNRYGARWRIGKARAAKARQVQAWKALPRPREMQRTAARRTEAWEAKVVSRLEEEKNRLEGESRCGEEVVHVLPKPREQEAKKVYFATE